MAHSIAFSDGYKSMRNVYTDMVTSGLYCFRNISNGQRVDKTFVREADPNKGETVDYVEITPEQPKSEAFDQNFWYALEMTSIYTPRGYEAVTIICNEKELNQARQVRDNPLVARFMRIVRINKDKVTEVVV